jgi:hypothetical protein
MKTNGIWVAISLAMLACGVAGAQTITPTLPEGSYRSSIPLAFSTSDPAARLFLRFYPTAEFVPLDRGLELTAVEGEERSYSIEVEARKDGTSVEDRTFTYLIDRKPPRAPEILPPSGVFPDSLSVSFSSVEPVYFSVSEDDSSVADFSLWNGSHVDLESPGNPDGQPRETRFRVSAFSVDAAGNPSPVVSADYTLRNLDFPELAVLAAPGPVSSAPNPAVSKAAGPAFGVAVSSSPSDSLTRIDATPKAPDGVLTYAITGPDSPPPIPVEYYDPGKPGSLSLSFSVPYAMKKTFALWIALRLPSGATVYPEKPLVFTVDRAPVFTPPPVPGAPVFAETGTDGGVTVSWRPYDGDIRYRIDGGEWRRYSRPFLFLASDRKSVTVEFFGIDARGRESDKASASFDLPDIPRLPSVSGLPPGGLTAKPVSVALDDGAAVRFEVAENGFPPEVGQGSRPWGNGPRSFEGRPGEEITYRVLVRSFSTDQKRSSPQVGFSFTVDRKPPEPPRFRTSFETTPQMSPAVISFFETEDRIMVSVHPSGEDGVFSEYRGPVAVGRAADDGQAWAIDAYTEDKAGNRSRMVTASVIVDAVSLYVSPTGKDSGPGSLENPVASLTRALALAKASGKTRIKLLGGIDSVSVAVDFPVEIVGMGDSPVQIRGLSSAAHSLISCSSADGITLRNLDLSLSRPTGEATVLSAVDCRSLRVLGTRIAGPGTESSRCIALSGSTARLESCVLSADGTSTSIALKADASNVSMTETRIEGSASARVSYLVLAESGSNLSIDTSALFVRGGRDRSAVSLSGGSLSLSRVGVSSDRGEGFTTLFDLSDAKASFSSCLIRGGASNYLTGFSFTRSKVTLVHDTLILDQSSAAATVRAIQSSSSGIKLYNSQLFSGKGSAFYFLDDSGTVELGASNISGFERRVDSAQGTGRTPITDKRVIAGSFSESFASTYADDGKGNLAMVAGAKTRRRGFTQGELEARGAATGSLGLDFYGSARFDPAAKAARPDLGAIQYGK